jgi:hypothetical protein
MLRNEPAVREGRRDPESPAHGLKGLALSGVAVPTVFGLCLWASGPPQRPTLPVAQASGAAVRPLTEGLVPGAQAAEPSDGTWQFTLRDDDGAGGAVVSPENGPVPSVPPETRS